MPRVYLPLLPIPFLALVVAFSACSRSGEPVTTHVIPPAAPYHDAAASGAAPAPLPSAATPLPTAPPPAAGPADDASEETPTAEEIAAFERAVPK